MIGKMQIQYEIMNEDNKDNDGSYIPSYDKLIAEAPNEEMKAKWQSCKDLFEKCAEQGMTKGFAFRCVYMIQLSCGHYTIYQHGVPDDWSIEKCEVELLDWIRRVDLHSNTKCMDCRGF